MKMGVSIGAAVVMLAILMPVYLSINQRTNKALALIVKGLCTFVAAVICFVGAWRSDTANAWFITAGLFFCLVGDVTLGIHFITGVLFFLFGHLCYLAAFFGIAPFSLWSMPVFLVVFSLIAFLFLKRTGRLPYPRLPLCFYAAVICLMLSTAVLLPAWAGMRGWVTAAGAVLFVLSDSLLATTMLYRRSDLINGISLTCYYAGQLLLALSVFLFA